MCRSAAAAPVRPDAGRGSGLHGIHALQAECAARWDDPPPAPRLGTAPLHTGLVMYWILLFIAGLFEIGWAVGLRYSDGWTRLIPSLLTLAAMAVSFALLSLALRGLPLGTAYAMWTGIGAVGTAIVGMLFLGEAPSVLRIASIVLIVIGLFGLKFAAR